MKYTNLIYSFESKSFFCRTDVKADVILGITYSWTWSKITDIAERNEASFKLWQILINRTSWQTIISTYLIVENCLVL